MKKRGVEHVPGVRDQGTFGEVKRRRNATKTAFRSQRSFCQTMSFPPSQHAFKVQGGILALGFYGDYHDVS